MNPERRHDYAQLHEDVAIVKTIVARLEKRLFGNGNLGAIGEIDNSLTDQGARISKLESDRAYTLGIFATLFMAFEVFKRRLLSVIGLGE